MPVYSRPLVVAVNSRTAKQTDMSAETISWERSNETANYTWALLKRRPRVSRTFTSGAE